MGVGKGDRVSLNVNPTSTLTASDSGGTVGSDSASVARAWRRIGAGGRFVP